MAVSTTNRKAGPFVGNDATTVFPFTFKVFDAEDLLVVLTDDVLVENTLVLDTDYTVILNGDQDDDPGGSVTLADALVTDNLLTITSQVEPTQTVVLTSQGGFFPSVLNRAFDKLTIIAQQLSETVGRTIRLPLSSTANGELPVPSPNALLAWNGTGDGFANIDISSLVTAGAYGTARVETFTGDGAKTDFNLANSPGTVANILVFIGGVAQVPGDDFALISAQRIRFTAAPFDGAAIQVRYATGGAVPASDDLARIDGSNVEAASFLEAVGGVAKSSQPIRVDDYYLPADGADYGLTYSRAYAAGLAQLRDLDATPGATYPVATNINVLPNLAGWTPSLNLNGATILITAEAGGFRRRGLKDGAVANAASGRIVNGTIDANNITGANGVRCIFGSNSGGTYDDVDIINMSQGYSWRRFCYADGGAVVGRPTYSGQVSGITDAGTATRWYGPADDGDQSYVQPGSPIAAGAARPLATVNNTQDSTGCANLATLRYWSNPTGAPINVPASMTSADYVTAGLTSGATDVVVNGVSMAAAKAEVYTSAQARFPRNVVRPKGAIFRNAFVTGGYYGFVAVGTDETTFDNVGSYGAVRGLACEFGAINLYGRNVLVRDSLSSGVLINYGSTDFDFGVVAIYGGSRWDGQALFNVQLGAARGSLSVLKTRTADDVTNGEYHFYLGPQCSGFRGTDFDLRGDCIKAFVCIESAWRTTAGAAQNYSASAEYNGLTSVALTDVDIKGVTIQVPDGTVSTAAALALCQTNDTTNGEIGLSHVRVRDFSAMSDKHSQHLVVREMATVTPTVTGVTNCRLTDFACPPLTAFANLADDMILPRGRKHFAEIKRVTNIDDDVLRPIQNLAAASITYGNRFILNGAAAVTNLEDNGSGATGQYPADGHVVTFRGSYATLNNNGASPGGTILKGASSVTPTTQQEITLRWDGAQNQALEVGRGF